jgi:hypothetical protein
LLFIGSTRIALLSYSYLISMSVLRELEGVKNGRWVGVDFTTDWLNIGGDLNTKNDQPDGRFTGSLRLSLDKDQD